MKTNDLRLTQKWVRTRSLDVYWYDNGQMWWYMEVTDGKYHGVDKRWYSNGRLRYDRVYENGELVKRIV